MGHGELQTSTHNFRLNNILRFLDLASNLLSIHKLCLQNNAFCYFDAENFSIQDLPSGRILYKGLSKNGVYPIPTTSTLSSSIAFNSKSSVFAFASIKLDLILLWHHRLGHPSSRILYSTLQNVIKNVSLSQIEKLFSSCTYCISAKMHKSYLNKTSIVSNSVLDIVHSDVWVPAPLTYVFGFNYYVIFVDDCTIFTWLFLLKHKHEILSMFKHFKALVETQYSTKIKVLTEYINTIFQAFCSSNGILHLTSCPHTPQQNGVSKRKHRHIVEIGLSLLYKSNLPYNYWSYAFSTTVYLINRLLSFILNFKSPW